MDSLFINSLLEDLKNPDEVVREEATRKLWRLWFQQKGVIGLEKIEASQKLLDSGKVSEAEDMLTQLIEDEPDFAEAWNRRAFLYYTNNEYEKSLLVTEHLTKKIISTNGYEFEFINDIPLRGKQKKVKFFAVNCA